MNDTVYYNDKSDKCILIEDFILPGQYKYVKIKDFNREVEKKVEGSQKTEKVMEEVTNETSL